MADVTDVLALPFPEGADANDVPADIEALATRLDEVPGIESLTGAEIAALGAALKPAGRVVFNSTTSKLQVSNGTSFVDIDAAALLLANNLSDLASAATARTNLGLGTAATTAATAYATSTQGATADAALARAGGTMSGAIAMGSQKITGLAKGTATGEAVARQQIQSGNTGAIANEGYATITFSPAFGSAPVVVFALTGVSNLVGADMWVSDVTVSSARINNSSGDVISANWIAVGN